MLIPLALLTWWVYAREDDGGFNRGLFAVQCENAVRAQLKAPATARFDAPAGRVEVEGLQARLTGTVDAQNSFGANLRSEFLCVGTQDNVSATLTPR